MSGTELAYGDTSGVRTEGAEREYRAGISLRPRYAMYGTVLQYRGRLSTDLLYCRNLICDARY
eukprot:3940988-Rhodomonas_salina.2